MEPAQPGRRNPSRSDRDPLAPREQWADLGIALLEDIEELRSAHREPGFIVFTDSTDHTRVHAASCPHVNTAEFPTESNGQGTRQRTYYSVRDIDAATSQWPTAPVHDCVDQQTQSDRSNRKVQLARRLEAEDSTIEFLGRSDETEELLRKRAAGRPADEGSPTPGPRVEG